MQNNHRKILLRIKGMHCPSCEVLLERKFRQIPGVKYMRINHANGKAEIHAENEIELKVFQAITHGSDYSVELWGHPDQLQSCTIEDLGKTTMENYIEIGLIFLIIMAAYLILRQLDVVPQLGVSDNMSYGFVFALGLVAAVSSCLAVTGGLLVAVAARYNETHPTATGMKKLVPHLYFNFGRIVSYTVLGGLVGLIGSVLTLSPKVNGVITIVVSVVMILLGFRLLKIFPWMRHLHPKMPKFLAHKLYDSSGSAKSGTSFILGAGTFFLPCGFTQALQLYVLSKGDFATGALTMLFFSLGTLPALLSLSALSSFARGGFQRYFLKFAGVIVLIFGFANINNGLALTGNSFSFEKIFSGFGDNSSYSVVQAENVKIVDGKQIAEMKVVGLGYEPANFTVVKGVPVEWRIDGSGAKGCAQVITVPDLGITEYLSQSGVTKINFTPEKTGKIEFSCTMGMTTRGAGFQVVDGTVAPKSDGTKSPSLACDPSITSCQDQVTE